MIQEFKRRFGAEQNAKGCLFCQSCSIKGGFRSFMFFQEVNSSHWNGDVSKLTSSWPTEIPRPHRPSRKPDTEIRPFIVQRFMRRIVLIKPMMRILESIFMEYRSFYLLLFGFPFFFKSCIDEKRI